MDEVLLIQIGAWNGVGELTNKNVNEASGFVTTGGRAGDKMEIALPPKYQAEDIKLMRTGMGISQKDFAAYLNVSPRTVEAWEAGRNCPSGAAARLIQIIGMDTEVVRRFWSGKDSRSLGCILKEKLKKKDYDKMLPIIERLEKGSASPAELKRVMGKSESTVRRCMDTLVKTGCVKKRGNTNNRIYEADASEKIILPIHRKNTT